MMPTQRNSISMSWPALTVLIFLSLVVTGCTLRPITPGQSGTAAQAESPLLPSAGLAGQNEVFVGAGPFLMGCSPDDAVCYREERPLHEVTLDAYWIDRTEVTNARFAACVAAGACTPPHEVSSTKRPSYYDNPELADYPVINVDWFQASAFCHWEGKRLPTEAEWEKAARGGSDTRIYPWGNDAPDATRAAVGNMITDTVKVGSYPEGASPYGALDMSGNVWEWVADRYNPFYYLESPAVNPRGPESGTNRVARSGWWIDTLPGVRVSTRIRMDPALWGYSVGFRCARTP